MLDWGDASDLLVAALVLAPASYFSTNLDNLLILSALLSQSARRAIVAAGFLMGNVATLLLAVMATAFAFLLPISFLGYLGLVPLAMGTRMLFKVETSESSAPAASTWPAVALVVLANSGDTLAVFGPLFAESEVLAAGGLALGFVAASLIVLQVAQAARRNRWLSARVEQVGPRLVPWAMIGVGLYVLANSTTDLV